ncbi:MAG: hypothetical protein FH748_17200 [Balneolaceae bacterium]|nr:hypothetical protein [Balneolaceae bacterium]
MTTTFKLIILCAIVCASLPLQAQDAQYPLIKGFGGIYEIQNSISPEPNMEYNIVVDLKTLQRDKESINHGLNNVARMMNLHVLGGVKPGLFTKKFNRRQGEVEMGTEGYCGTLSTPIFT